MSNIYNEIKEKIRINQAILAVLEKPIKESPYTRNKQNIERKKENLKKEIQELKEKLENMNNI